ncbi:PREDICTED: TBC1 domain family member 19 [Nicrophorus vespilloides]|uniref:TBC1 domain family member 19 n=1 Tax=Nicrophorus vespilloides TaxID=110193 RepID=A0ABM1N8H8_NICVS|nr:PREDICTED: TBC1 domain family member 19 [Nicrophorus vespilloides]
MEELKDKGMPHTSQKICDSIQKHPSYIGFIEEVQKLVSSSNVSVNNFNETLMKAMREKGIECHMKNNVFHWVASNKKYKMDSPIVDLAFFKRAQVQWDKRIHKSLNSMCSELGITLARARSSQDREELSEKWGELSNYDIDVSKYRPVYAPKDFLEVLLHLKSPNCKVYDIDPNWEFAHLPIKVKDLPELRQHYGELSRGEQILGTHTYGTLFEAERIQIGERVLAQHYAPVAQEYLKRGCPKNLRSEMWSLVLGADINMIQSEYYESLKNHTLYYDLMIDKLIIKDIQLTASNDDQYFVFEDVLYQVMLCFMRDGDILKHISSQPGYMQVILKGKQPTSENTMTFPPSGVIPFHGFTMYAAPICYLFQDPLKLYYVFRAFYLRYWHRLHRVCGHEQGIVSICLLFERLLQKFEPALWHHFREISISPIKVVFKWLMRAFSGHLPPEQVLQLWDLVLAYDSLEVIALLAVIIMIFRKDNLLQVTTLTNIESVLADISSINVIPLLQMALLK